MKIGQNLIRKFQDGGAVYSVGDDYQNPYNFALYNYLAGLSGDEFQEAMAANFGMEEHLDDDGNPYDYSSLFQQYDPLAQEALGDTYSSALGKAEGKTRNTLEEAFRLARSGNQGFGRIGSSLKEAFNRSFNTRREAGDLASQQYQTGVFDLQSDFTSEFEDLVAQISGYGAPFDSSLIDEDWTMDGAGEGNIIIDDPVEEELSTEDEVISDSDAGNVGAEGDESLTDSEGNFGGSWGGGGPGTGEPVIGCMESGANNYNPNANQAGYCSYGPTGTTFGDFDDVAQEVSGDTLGSPGKFGDLVTGGA